MAQEEGSRRWGCGGAPVAEARGGGASRGVESGRPGLGRRSPKAAGVRARAGQETGLGRSDAGRAGLAKDGKKRERCPEGPAPTPHLRR